MRFLADVASVSEFLYSVASDADSASSALSGSASVSVVPVSDVVLAGRFLLCRDLSSLSFLYAVVGR